MPVTIEDILSKVDVSSRTIRNWVKAGLLPRPQRKGMGYRQGVIGIYPDNTVERAKFIRDIRMLSRNGERLLRLVKEDSNKKIYIGIDEEGCPFIRYVPRSFWKENHD